MQAIECLARACAATAIGAFEQSSPNRIIASRWSDDANTQWLMRAATTLTDTSSAPALLRTLLPDFIAALH